MVKTLGLKDKRVITHLQEIGVLEEINGQELRRKCPNGSIVVYCGDGDQSLEFQLHLLSIQLGISMDELYSIRQLIALINERGVRMHQHAHNGGPLRLAKELRVDDPFRIDDHLMAELEQSRKLKQIPTLILTLHVPCGLQELAKYSIQDSIWQNIENARRIEKTLDWDHNRIIVLMHVDFGDGRKRTYFVKKKKKDLVYG